MGKKKTEPVALPPGRLWPNMPSGSPLDIAVFGATGEWATGKTILGLSIAPGVHQSGEFEGQPRTLYLDYEESGGTYGGAGAHRVNVPQKLMAGEKLYTPVDLWKHFVAVTEAVKIGQYDVRVQGFGTSP